MVLLGAYARQELQRTAAETWIGAEDGYEEDFAGTGEDLPETEIAHVSREEFDNMVARGEIGVIRPDEAARLREQHQNAPQRKRLHKPAPRERLADTSRRSEPEPLPKPERKRLSDPKRRGLPPK